MLNVRKSVKGKLGLGFGIILILAVLVGAVSVYSINKTADVTNRIYSQNLIGVRTVAALNNQLNAIQSKLMGLQGALNFSQQDKAKKLAAEIKGVRKKYDKIWSTYYPDLVASKNEMKVAKQVMAARKALEPKMDAFNKRIQGGYYMMAKNYYYHKVNADFLALFDQLRQLSDLQAQSASAAYAEGVAVAGLSTRVIVGVVIFEVLLTLVITFLLTRMITRPLGRARTLVESIAGGSLDNRVDNPFKDEFGATLGALEAMQTRLAGIVAKVRGSSESVMVGTSEIASGNDELSSRTQQQSANLQETAASMEQMTSTVRQNADNAMQADQLTKGVNKQADEGGEVIGRAVSAMAEINESSRRITDIIGLIDDIAFQTNLLALNASVEAARAGEQGRGFAVVASEVRNLAGRCATAAKDIKALVEETADKVKVGSKQVELSGNTLQGIIESISKVSDIVSEIATASNEQSSGIDQVNLAVSEMDSMTQQNASLVEQSAAASRSLEEQARVLRREVAFFRLSGDEAEAVDPTDTTDTAETGQLAAPGANEHTPQTSAAASAEPDQPARGSAARQEPTHEPRSKAESDPEWASF